jgi:NAD+ synthase
MKTETANAVNEGTCAGTALGLDPEREVARIKECLRHLLTKELKRRGFVVGVSGGIDSAVTAALAARAVGPERVLALLMPERHSGEQTLALSRSVAESLGISCLEEDITGFLEAVGFYRRYEAAARKVIPAFRSDWKSKITIQAAGGNEGFNYFVLIAQSPDGLMVRERLPLEAYLEIVAATNFKQRTRKMLEYYHADRLNYAVAGTPNRLEYDQGFFVKLGDGAADIKPIAHLYKTQVYQLAEYLKIPDAVRHRPPTTDTYSLAQTQDEFYFAVPYQQMDLCLYGKNHGLPPEEVAAATGLSLQQVLRIWLDINRKRQTTRYLHLPPLLVEEVKEVSVHAERSH